MTVTVLHANTYEDWTRGNQVLRDLRCDAEPDAVRRALEEGLYLAVATVEGATAAGAWAATQNRGEGSWSRRPGPGVAPKGGGTVEGRGFRDTGTGDLLVARDGVHVVGCRGIEKVGIDPAQAAGVREIGEPEPGAAPGP